MRRTKTMLMGDILQEFFERPYIAARIAEGKIDETWREVVGERVARLTRSIKLENHILYVVIESSLVRQELFYQREALKEALNKQAKVQIVNAVIVK